MTSQYNTSSWRDDLDLEPNTHPAIAHAIHHMRTGHAVKLVNDRLWPFPACAIPPDGTPPPEPQELQKPQGRRCSPF